MKLTSLLLVRVALACLLAAGAAAGAEVAGRIVDATGASVPGASVTLRLKASGADLLGFSAIDGSFAFNDIAAGEYDLVIRGEGFAEHRQLVAAPATAVQVQLRPADLATLVVVHASEVIGSQQAARYTPGAVDVLDAAILTQSRVFTFDEALRKVAGVYTRGEEGFGLRPNIGIRGLNPTRSSKVLLLEDGIPISYAPYGDNASYYHPPVDRFDAIEVVKGSGQILYGPSTVGGVINYITPAPPERAGGSVTLIGGNRDYLNGHARFGTTLGSTGLLFDFMRKQGEGTRENTRFGLNDGTFKLLQPLSARQTLSLKANYYGEDSNLTYSGMRLSEFLANPRGNPFRNDFLDFNRYGAAAAHTFAFTPEVVLSTNLYGSMFFRDWWRQSSNSAQRPNDAADPACGGLANLDSTCGNEGRLRKYYTWGVEPRVRVAHDWFGTRDEMDFGFRGHFEQQDRLQMNGERPTSRSGIIVESNDRRNQAWAGFLQHRFIFGKWGFTPGVRLEHVRYERFNRLMNVRGHTQVTQLIPGIGISYSPSGALAVFAGVHRGFAPPRTEDIISNTTGGSIDLDPELSWNYEAGARARVGRWLTLEGTLFRMDFENQIIPASIAGGIGATLTNAGSTLHQGMELSSRIDWRSMLGSRHSAWLRTAWTYVSDAEFASVRYSAAPGFTNLPVSGNRIPYAPEHLLNASVGYMHASGVNALVESVYTGRQFADDLNTINATADGQRGVIPPAMIWNATVTYPIEAARTTLFVTAKNLGDRLYIVDRARGILPGMPRLAQFGLRFGF